MVNISILEEFIHDKCHTIIKNSKEKEKFTSELIDTIKKINTSQLGDKNSLEVVVQEFARCTDLI